MEYQWDKKNGKYLEYTCRQIKPLEWHKRGWVFVSYELRWAKL